MTSAVSTLERATTLHKTDQLSTQRFKQQVTIFIHGGPMLVDRKNFAGLRELNWWA